MTTIERILAERPEKQKEIAAQVGISDAYLSQIANGKRVPRMPIAIRLAAVLGTSMEDLFASPVPTEAGATEMI